MSLSTTDTPFVDSNVIIYVFDRNEPEKRAIARSVLTSMPPQTMVISTQVLQEFAAVALRKNRQEPNDVRRLLDIHRLFRVEPVTLQIVYDAVELVAASQLSYWDARIVSSARSAGCNVLVTEDSNAGQVIDGVRVYNPFGDLRTFTMPTEPNIGWPTDL